MKTLALALGGVAALYAVSLLVDHPAPPEVQPASYSETVRAGCQREFPDAVTECMTTVMVRDADARQREALDRIR